MPPRELVVRLYGTDLATLHDDSRNRLSLSWADDGASRWPINSTVLSILLPLTPGSPPPPARVQAFFAGLLPEGNARTHLAVDAGVDPDDVFGMLVAYGRDVAGALDIAPSWLDSEVGATRRVAVDRAGVRRLLERADTNDGPLGVVPGVTSLSLAGMQPKIALYQAPNGQWSMCPGGAPSTHILKPGRPGTLTSDLIYNEAYCLAIAREIKLTTVDAAVESFDGRDALVVSRYDRFMVGGAVERIHQEDAAQMLGLSTDDPSRKFQFGRTLPSLRHIADILDREHAPRAPLLALTTFNVAIGNTDAHAKNISVLHDADGGLSLAPAYDVSPHRHYPFGGRSAAMDVNGGHEIDAISVTDLVAEGTSWGLRADAARRTVEDTLVALGEALCDERVADAHPMPAPEARACMTERVARLLDDLHRRA